MPSRRSIWRAVQVSGVLIAGALALAACGADKPMSTLDTHGTHAENILALLTPIAWAALAVFVVVEGILVYAIWKFRARKNDAMPAQIHGNTTIEIAWTIAPALIVLVIAVLTFRTQAVNSRMDPTALRIQAVGHQWWFEFKYPDQSIVTSGDLYIPVGRDVTVQLDGVDVIHNFWIPKLAGKTYMIPGNTNYLSFKATNEGVYRGQCAEFCGEAHALMRFRVIAVQPDVFDRWIAAHTSTPAAASTQPYAGPEAFPNTQEKYVPHMPAFPQGAYTGVGTGGVASNGYTVFEKKCAVCHMINDNPKAKGVTGPNLTYLGDRTTLAAGLLPNNSGNLYSWIYDPSMIKPGNIMGGTVKPGYLTDQEIKDLIAYLEGQKTNIPLPQAR